MTEGVKNNRWLSRLVTIPLTAFEQRKHAEGKMRVIATIVSEQVELKIEATLEEGDFEG